MNFNEIYSEFAEIICYEFSENPDRVLVFHPGSFGKFRVCTLLLNIGGQLCWKSYSSLKKKDLLFG